MLHTREKILAENVNRRGFLLHFFVGSVSVCARFSGHDRSGAQRSTAGIVSGMKI